MESHETMIDLTSVINFDGFRYDKDHYLDDEIDILQPRLKALGYTQIKWMRGEQDSFGPLTRRCEAMNPRGNVVVFVYG